LNEAELKNREAYDEVTPPATALDILLLSFRLQGQLSSVLSVLSREFGLGPAEAVSLIWLGRGPVPISGVAKAAGIRPNGASVLVDRLKERKLVRRQRSKRDNRVVTVELTETGKEVADALTERVGDQLRFVFSPLPPNERENLVLLLGRLVGP
jgi:DNA-binding MarR family transcriptional regulator